MIEAIHNDCIKRFGSDETGSRHVDSSWPHTGTDTTAIHEFREEVAAKFPNHDIYRKSAVLKRSLSYRSRRSCRDLYEDDG